MRAVSIIVEGKNRPRQNGGSEYVCSVLEDETCSGGDAGIRGWFALHLEEYGGLPARV